MTFASRAQKPPPPRDLCAIGVILAGLSEDEAAGLRDMLADTERWGHVGKGSVQEAMIEEGYPASDRTIRLHRAGTCRCTSTRPKA